jgi:protocatechuate 3,4-dioxygenase beta subunit
MPATRTRRRLLLAGLTLPAWVGAADLQRVLAPMTDGPFYPPARWRTRNPLNRLGRRPDPGAPRRRRPSARAANTWRWRCGGRPAGPADRPRRGRDLAMRRAGAVPPPRRGRGARRFDPGFQGFGAARSGSDGALAFRTIRPVPYPGRTPHIHVKLRHASFGELTSQLFIAGDPGNARDFLWRAWPPPTASALAMQLQPATDAGLRWQTRHALVVPACKESVKQADRPDSVQWVAPP